MRIVSDPQLDELMVDRLKIEFDPLDLPEGVFVLAAGERMARQSKSTSAQS